MIYGERIRQVRKLKRFTQTYLADSVGVDQTVISRVEAGLLKPSVELLDAIALKTGFPESFFRRPPGPEFPLGSLLFRARRSITKTDMEEAHAWAELVYECALGLAARIQRIRVSLPSLSGETPAGAAEITRSALGLSPDRPIANLVNTLERHGVFVLAVPVALTGRDAFSAWATAEPRVPVIVVPVGAPGDRLRFSISHELAHLAMHQSYRGNVADMEGEANRFAGAFLMPESGIAGELQPPVTLLNLEPLKRRWGVALQALIMRARELGIVSERRSQQLFQLISQSGHRLREPERLDIPIEKPRAFRKMAEIVLGNPLSPRRLADEFDIPIALAAAIIDGHAERSEVRATVVDNFQQPRNVVSFSRNRKVTDSNGGVVTKTARDD